MANRKISHAKGKGSITHNNRNHIYGNVDPSRTQNNIYYAKENLEDVYQKCFGEALAQYNEKQKRADRKIKDYYAHLFGNTNKDTVATSSNKENSFYEIVVGIGCKNTCATGSADGELSAKILDEYAKGFSERNPNFYVFNSVLHLDETTPHLHINYVPVADGYKNGMSVRNSQSVALEQMGYGKQKLSINDWRKAERQILRELCQQHGLEIAEETEGRGKTFTPDEYKKMRDETKEELQADTVVMGELKSEIKQESTAELQGEISEEKSKLQNVKEQLAQETAKLENRVAFEKPIKLMFDNIREETKGWGNNKKKYTIIEVPEMTKETALAVLKAAQQSAKDRANAKKFKEERDTAVTEKNNAIADKDNAIQSQLLAEQQKNTAKATAKNAEEKAKAVMKKANKKMEQGTELFNQQTHLNSLYDNAIADLSHYKNKSVRVEEENTELKRKLERATISLGAMAKANGSLLYDPNLKLHNPTPEQERLLKATRNYAVSHIKGAGFEDIANDVDKHYGISKGVQECVEELTPKPVVKKKSLEIGMD